MSIKDNINAIKTKITEAESKAKRAPGSVKLIAVSKFNPYEAVEEALKAGQLSFGENRVQEAAEKFLNIKDKFPKCELHIIGQLQTNKVKKAVEIAQYIHSVDRLSLVQEIEKQCSKLNKSIKILFEVHTGEESKSGYTSEDDLIATLEEFKKGCFPHIIPVGFMTMAPFTEDKNLIRKSFTILRELSIKLQKSYPMFNFTELSMGMSGDYEIAIEEGATMVRIGTAIFGERNYTK